MKKSLKMLFIVCFCFLFIAGCTANPTGNTSDVSNNPSGKSSVTESENSEKTSVETSKETSEENSKESSEEKDDPTLSALRETIRKNDSMVGVAFVGYVNSESTEKDLSDYLKNSACAKKYPFLSDCNPVINEGAEMYAFVPSDNNCTITVYKADISEDGEYIDYKDTPLYQGKAGESVVLFCNLSEIYSNVLVSVTDGTKTLEFRPMLSMMDGHLARQDGCYDFSVYNSDGETSDLVQSAYDLLMSNDEVRRCCEQGMAMLYTGDSQIVDGNECLLFALGTEQEDQFVREQYYAVSGDTVYYYDEIDDEWIAPRAW